MPKQTKLTKQHIFAKLVQIGTMPHGGSDHPRPVPWTASDLIDQDALYALQANYLALLHEVARDIGPTAEDTLVRRFPWAFHVATAPNPAPEKG